LLEFQETHEISLNIGQMRFFSFLLMFASTAACAQTLKAELKCRLTSTDYVYDCAIKLGRGGRPLAGVDVTVDADMPTMPKMHSVIPVTAKPGKVPGEYAAKLDLEMLGQWAVRLRLAGPVQEELILLYDFDEKGARPVIQSGKPPRK
jgi:hypothetical protein